MSDSTRQAARATRAPTICFITVDESRPLALPIKRTPRTLSASIYRIMRKL